MQLIILAAANPPHLYGLSKRPNFEPIALKQFNKLYDMLSAGGIMLSLATLNREAFEILENFQLGEA